MQVEAESNRRVERYKQYARGMKHKFAEFERQSEDYYGGLLEKFKVRATNEIQRKERELKELETAKREYEERIFNVKGKLIERKVKGIKEILSDDEMESDDDDSVIAPRELMEAATRLGALSA